METLPDISFLLDIFSYFSCFPNSFTSFPYEPFLNKLLTRNLVLGYISLMPTPRQGVNYSWVYNLSNFTDGYQVGEWEWVEREG